jgi:hypothetical protein
VIDGELPARTLHLMLVLSNVYSAFRSYKAGAHRLADWAQANTAYFNIVAEVREMRKNA